MPYRDIRFATVTPDAAGRLVESNIRILKHSDLMRCPHTIIATEHYRPDGTCKCDDPNETVMKEWGYRWNGKRKAWL